METQDSIRDRLFIVGCSYSKYVSPTYGDFLGAYFNQTLNCARSGAGNDYIFQTAAFLFEKFKPTEKDTVIVQWSGIGRWDHIFYGDTGYTTPGSLDWQDYFDLEIVDKYFNLVQKGYELINYITAIKAISERYGCKFATFNMLDPWIGNLFGEPYQTFIFNKHFDYIKKWFPYKKLEETFNKVQALSAVEEYVWKHPLPRPLYYYDQDGRQDETHPSPTQHIKYAQYLDRELDLKCSNIYSDKLNEYANTIEDMYSIPDFDFDKFKKGEYPGTELFNTFQSSIQVEHKKYPSYLFGNKWENYSNNFTEWKE